MEEIPSERWSSFLQNGQSCQCQRDGWKDLDQRAERISPERGLNESAAGKIGEAQADHPEHGVAAPRAEQHTQA